MSSNNREEARRQRHAAHAETTYRDFLTLASSELAATTEVSERTVVAVMHALESLLPFEEMQDLASELPTALRELLGRCDQPDHDRPHARTREEVVRAVAEELGLEPAQAQEQVRAVFRVLTQTVSHGEIKQVIHLLPSRVRAMWPAVS